MPTSPSSRIPIRRSSAALVRVCPAGLYKLGAANERTFDYAGCLECGTCRIVAGGGIVANWEYPQPTMGVEYRYG